MTEPAKTPTKAEKRADAEEVKARQLAQNATLVTNAGITNGMPWEGPNGQKARLLASLSDAERAALDA